MGYTVTTNNCQPALKNALVDILKIMPDKHRLTVIEKFEQVYNVRIYFEKIYTWSSIEFQSQEHFIEWYLKWA